MSKSMVKVMGSLDDNPAFDKTRIKLMMRATTKESGRELTELVKKYLPDDDTGALRRSVKNTGSLRRGSGRFATYESTTYSNHEYAAHIEYGTSPHYIRAKNVQKLAFEDPGESELVYSPVVLHPGHEGFHMFQKAAAEFEMFEAEDIAEQNARQWLGTMDAGRRTFII